MDHGQFLFCSKPSRQNFRFNVSANISPTKSFRYNNLLSCGQELEENETKIELAICLFTGVDEIMHLPEFIVYHNLMGVDKFYVYFNAKDEEIEETWHYLKPFVDSGLIELIPFYFKTRSYIDGIQVVAYNDCLYKHKDYVKWLGILDTDEFFMLAPTSPFKLLTDYLKSLENYSQIAFPTAFFVYQNGNVSFYMEKCKFPSFINDWLLMADERENRPPKSIYRAGNITYADVHGARGFDGSIRWLPMEDALLGHYRYPYLPFTIEGIKNGTYTKNDYYKTVFGAKIIEKLHEIGFDKYKVNCV